MGISHLRIRNSLTAMGGGGGGMGARGGMGGGEVEENWWGVLYSTLFYLFYFYPFKVGSDLDLFLYFCIGNER